LANTIEKSNAPPGGDKDGIRAVDSGALALESARAGITVNAVCPGYIHTEMLDAVGPDAMAKSILPLILVGRLGEPGDIARAVVFLAADEAGFITGSTLSINGGQYMSQARRRRMTSFDRREEAFEAKFVHDEECRAPSRPWKAGP
jgi:short-subunit dehydrogenase